MLPLFVEKNKIPKDKVNNSKLLKQLLADGDLNIIGKDINKEYHFNGNFRNAGDLKVALDNLAGSQYEDLAEQDRSLVLQIFEDIFIQPAAGDAGDARNG